MATVYKGRVLIDLAAEDGNAFALMGIAANLARQMGDSKDQIEHLTDLMKKHDYEFLLGIFERKFRGLFEFLNDPRTTTKQQSE